MSLNKLPGLSSIFYGTTFSFRLGRPLLYSFSLAILLSRGVRSSAGRTCIFPLSVGAERATVFFPKIVLDQQVFPFFLVGKRNSPLCCYLSFKIFVIQKCYDTIISSSSLAAQGFGKITWCLQVFCVIFLCLCLCVCVCVLCKF